MMGRHIPRGSGPTWSDHLDGAAIRQADDGGRPIGRADPVIAAFCRYDLFCQ